MQQIPPFVSLSRDDTGCPVGVTEKPLVIPSAAEESDKRQCKKKRGAPKGGISRLAKMRKPQCTGVHEDFRIKRNAEITLLVHLSMY